MHVVRDNVRYPSVGHVGLLRFAGISSVHLVVLVSKRDSNSVVVHLVATRDKGIAVVIVIIIIILFFAKLGHHRALVGPLLHVKRSRLDLLHDEVGEFRVWGNSILRHALLDAQNPPTAFQATGPAPAFAVFGQMAHLTTNVALALELASELESTCASASTFSLCQKRAPLLVLLRDHLTFGFPVQVNQLFNHTITVFHELLVDRADALDRGHDLRHRWGDFLENHVRQRGLVPSAV